MELTLPDVFQHWQAETTDETVSFGIANASQAPVLWSLELPADAPAAEATLAQAEAQVKTIQAVLVEAPERLDAFVTRLGAGGGVQFAVESFPAAGAQDTPAETALLSWIDAFHPDQVSFSAPGLAKEDVSAAVSQMQQVMNRLLGQLLHLAQVETLQEGRLLARSLVSWKGDLDTSWEETASLEQRGLHQRSLRLALASRLALLKMIVTAAQGSARIATLIAAPGAALLALPAAWKYLNALLDQARAV